MKKFSIFVIVLFMVICASAQVTLNGNTFIKEKNKDIKTEYFYQEDSVKYQVYKSSKGKYFIWKISKKSGKKYKKYIPEINTYINKN